jgi:high-affinity K+ transport system ATPase subunit B
MSNQSTLPIAPVTGDGFNGHPVVESAYLAVALFTGANANRAAAEVALRR